ncbi:hypothetical protein PsYK624_123330 [Phanerochaete sordida]|uniref:Uncharacterized protein n=1 Tax=Phanerochaete sordida TaxID=48140 RepID=A0A9P3GJ87_9APHY|nr:hypothetical protein PsYK624_123330 [Phanerochaete sordida]
MSWAAYTSKRDKNSVQLWDDDAGGIYADVYSRTQVSALGFTASWPTCGHGLASIRLHVLAENAEEQSNVMFSVGLVTVEQSIDGSEVIKPAELSRGSAYFGGEPSDSISWWKLPFRRFRSQDFLACELTCDRQAARLALSRDGERISETLYISTREDVRSMRICIRVAPLGSRQGYDPTKACRASFRAKICCDICAPASSLHRPSTPLAPYVRSPPVFAGGTTLPLYIIDMVKAHLAALAARSRVLSSREDWIEHTALRRHALVCRDWAHTFRPLLHRYISLESQSQLQTFCDTAARTVLAPQLGTFVRKLSGKAGLSLELVLVGRTRPSLTVLDGLSWGAPHAPIAPPRIAQALAALLRPLRSLTQLELAHRRFTTFAQLTRVLHALPHLTAVRLRDIHCSRYGPVCGTIVDEVARKLCILESEDSFRACGAGLAPDAVKLALAPTSLSAVPAGAIDAAAAVLIAFLEVIQASEDPGRVEHRAWNHRWLSRRGDGKHTLELSLYPRYLEIWIRFASHPARSKLAQLPINLEVKLGPNFAISTGSGAQCALESALGTVDDAVGQLSAAQGFRFALDLGKLIGRDVSALQNDLGVWMPRLHSLNALPVIERLD